MDTKVCNRCHTEQPISKFELKTKEGRRSTICNRCKWVREKPKRVETMYGITQEEYRQMVETQGGICEICKENPIDSKRYKNGLVIDHDHQTGKVRALLCDWCNTSLGLLEDRVDLLKAAIAYLEHHNNTPDTTTSSSNSTPQG